MEDNPEFISCCSASFIGNTKFSEFGKDSFSIHNTRAKSGNPRSIEKSEVWKNRRQKKREHVTEVAPRSRDLTEFETGHRKTRNFEDFAPAFDDSGVERTTFLSVLTEKYPWVPAQDIWEAMNEECPDEEVEPYLSLLAAMFPDIDVYGDYSRTDWRFTTTIDDHTMRDNPYREKDRMRRADNGFPKIREEVAKMEAYLKGADHKDPYCINVTTAYKPKAKKVQPVDANDGTGETPGGRRDWYVLSKERDFKQPQTGKYKDYLLPRFCSIPRGSRLTPERLQLLNVGDWLWEEEKLMFFELMLNHESVIAFDWVDCGRIHEDVTPPIVIKTIPHKAWQERNFPCPKALFPIVAQMLIDRLNRGVLEKSNGPYRNPWFLVAKKIAGTYRLINAAMKMNSVTLRDANMPPSVDEFSEEFAGCQCASLIDFFSGYDQLILDPRCRDMTAFMTPVGLLRMTTVPQGATNSVAQFVRVIMTILEDIFPKVAMPFLDDVGVKGPYSDYSGEEKLPGVRRYVFEHLQNLDRTLDRVERAGAKIGAKSVFCADGMNIVGFITGSGGRAPASSKIVKILEWPPCQNTTEAKAFLGVCVYYRIWIKDFGKITEPIYRLFKKKAVWEWGPEQEAAMKTLKGALTTAPLLCKIHYDPAEGWGKIILAVDSSLWGWGATLGQIDDKGKKRVARYESGLWNPAERNYDAGKRECRGILKTLQKLRYWLYGVRFVLETDANTLVAQLNRAATDLPGALVTRWLAWIRLFDFEVKHIKGRVHSAADGLSRRPRTESDDIDDANEVDIDEFIAAELDSAQICRVEASSKLEPVIGRIGANPASLNLTIEDDSGEESRSTADEAEEQEAGVSNSPDIGIPFDYLEATYSDEHQEIARFLTTLERPEGLSRGAFRAFKAKALKYSIRDRLLWRNATAKHPPRLVIDTDKDKATIIGRLHDSTGHSGRESTYRRVANRFFWEGMYNDVAQYVASCKPCQRKSKERHEEALYNSQAVPLFRNLAIDIIKMPDCGAFGSLLVLRDDFSGWVEAVPMPKAPSSKQVADWIWENIICRHGIFGRLRVDGGTEFKGAVIRELKRRGVKRVSISAYNAKGNGMIERGHQPIVQALLALTVGTNKKWVNFLPQVLFADRTSVHEPTGWTPFYTVYGREPILPVETEFPTWRTLAWDEIQDRASLLAMRARQIEMRDEDIEEARLRKDRRRELGKEYFDSHHRIRKSKIGVGDTVLAYDVNLMDNNKSRNTKLLSRWLGPFRVRTANHEKGSYILEEFDGTRCRGTYSGNRLKKFVKRKKFWYSPDDEAEGSIPLVRFDHDAEDTEEPDIVIEDVPEEGETEQVLQKDTGVIVREQLRTLTDRQKARYLRFEEDWADEVVVGSASVGYNLVARPQIEIDDSSLDQDPWDRITEPQDDLPIDIFADTSLCISSLW